MNEKLLEEIGLTRGEIVVYTTLLKLGETTTGKIVEEAQISSGKIYEILEKLIKKGLVSYIIKEKTKYFSAASPNRILDYLHEREEDLKNKAEELKKELPVLINLEKSKTKQETRLFRGMRGFQTAIFEALDALKSDDEVLGMGIITTKSTTYNIVWKKWHAQRIKRKIKCRMIFSDKKSEYYKHFLKMPHTKVKVLTGVTPAAVDVMGDRVLILTHGKEPSVLSIINSEIAQSFTSFFNSLWNIAKE
ncbi:MAG: helix-turn-helix domain-containing protein [Nanoarchaeota archaeon]